MNNSPSLKVVGYLISLLTIVSCVISIPNNGIYQDGDWANAQWLGQDVVTLLIAFPLLLFSTEQGISKGNLKWKVVFAAMMLYFSYVYSFFMFVAELTPLYIFHLPIFGLSTIGLVLACIQLFSDEYRVVFQSTALKYSVAAYLILISLMISMIWISDIFAHLTDPSHQSETPNGKAPLIIYSLDLGIIIPLMITSGIMIFRNRDWGYLLNGIMLVKTSTLGFALMAMSVSMYIQQLNPETFLIGMWCVIGILGSLLSVLFMRQLEIKLKL